MSCGRLPEQLSLDSSITSKQLRFEKSLITKFGQLDLLLQRDWLCTFLLFLARVSVLHRVIRMFNGFLFPVVAKIACSDCSSGIRFSASSGVVISSSRDDASWAATSSGSNRVSRGACSFTNPNCLVMRRFAGRKKRRKEQKKYGNKIFECEF